METPYPPAFPPPTPPYVPEPIPVPEGSVETVGAAASADTTIFDRLLLTASQTFCWSLSAIAFIRTLGCSITDACVSNLFEVSTQRPCSTQKTERSTGSLSAGTILSLLTPRSCLPPVTTSPA